ncbi:MAG: hypothetical protein A2Z92_00325 [Omnitrophica WOR_2 bacterium GWA2_63_20]|nr:MAG: hypothetical protein A2Z92_00325 [Omnitrophica WOR_2 bacterium GWA2_63_20]HBQ38881.1 hypothetical protein [Candidatus Omnitrophota bacterium]
MLQGMSEERRRSPRIRCVLPVRLYPQGETKVIQTLTKDVSIGGLKCLSPLSKPVSTPLSVELDLGRDKTVMQVRARTVWFQQVPNGEQFYLGIMFDELSDRNRQLLSRYLDSPRPPSSR